MHATRICVYVCTYKLSRNWPGTSRKRAREDDEHRTKANYDALKVPALREMRRAKKLKQAGLKADLIRRLKQADHPSEPPDQADQPPEPPDQADQPPEPPDQADQLSDWLSAQDIDDMYAERPRRHNIMKRIMEKAVSRVCNVTGMTYYKISMAKKRHYPGGGLCQLVKYWKPN